MATQTRPLPQARADQAAAPEAAPVDRAVLIQVIELQNQGQIDRAELLFQIYLDHHPNDPAALSLYSLAVILPRKASSLTTLFMPRACAATVSPRSAVMCA